MDNSSSFAGSIPENYDNGLGPFLFEPYAIDIVERIPDATFNDVLELACGTGRVTKHLVQKLHSSKIIASDLNQDMLSIAEKKITSANIEWKVVDMQSIPFPDNHFDLIVCQYGLMFVPDKKKAMAEIFRVLKQGGRFLFNTWDKLENNGAAFTADEVVNQHFKSDPVPFYKVPFSLHDKDYLFSLVTESGFGKISITNLQKTGISKSMNVAKGFVEGSPAYVFIQQRDVSLVPRILNELEKELIRRFHGDPIKVSMKAWIGEAVK